MLNALMIAATLPGSQSDNVKSKNIANAASSVATSAIASASSGSMQISREIANVESAFPLQADKIMLTSKLVHSDLRAAAVRFEPSANTTIGTNYLAEHRAIPVVAKCGATPDLGRARSAPSKGWVGTGRSFVSGVAQGTVDGGESMVRGISDLTAGGFHFATDGQARAEMFKTVAQNTVALARFAKTIATNPAEATNKVGHAVHSALSDVLSTYKKASEGGHLAEFIGKTVGQGAVLAATLPIPGGAEAKGVAAIGEAVRVTETAVDFARQSDALKIAGGHAWAKHQAEFSGWNQGDFTKAVQTTLQHPDGEKSLSRGRIAYWNEQEKMVVIRDPQNPDAGTAFRPKTGKSYFDLGLK